MATNRYTIERHSKAVLTLDGIIFKPTGKWNVWDNDIGVVVASAATKRDAEAWVSRRTDPEYRAMIDRLRARRAASKGAA